MPTSSRQAEGNIAGSAMRELSEDPARSKTLCMRGTFMCENREIPRFARRRDLAAGRPGKAEAVSLG
ncbi:MAG: hypothetical protein GEU78_13385 [Actinobacteria bacterium]|nr:hypothetical protein [Actinomycetota bacterium]